MKNLFKILILLILLNSNLFSQQWRCLEGDCENGSGVYQQKINENIITYIGGFKDGLFHDYGSFYLGEDLMSEGQYMNGTLHGQGTEYYLNQKYESYVGEFKNGIKDGYGTLTYSDGSTYIGEFKNDVRHGLGTFTNNGKLTKGTVYVGEFKNDLYHGFGKITFPEGQGFEGTFVNNEMNGQITMLYPDGSKRIVEFLNGKPVTN